MNPRRASLSNPGIAATLSEKIILTFKIKMNLKLLPKAFVFCCAFAGIVTGCATAPPGPEPIHPKGIRLKSVRSTVQGVGNANNEQHQSVTSDQATKFVFNTLRDAALTDEGWVPFLTNGRVTKRASRMFGKKCNALVRAGTSESIDINISMNGITCSTSGINQADFDKTAKLQQPGLFGADYSLSVKTGQSLFIFSVKDATITLVDNMGRQCNCSL